MIKKVAAIRYAKAYFAHCEKTNSIKEAVNESENLIEILAHNSNLNKTLKNKIVPNQTKKKIMLTICGNVSENLKSLIEILVMKNRLNLFNDILNQFIELYKISSGMETCYLISAEKTTSKIDENLRHIIKKITKNKIKIINVIDKDLIGGFILKVGDIQFDNSISSTLSKLRTTLKKENTFI
tara:strand:+ start:7273 stop:7821 length:549 start_codon:yes stop_codon:yes gene_type:complete